MSNRVRDWFRAVADVGYQRAEINRLNVQLHDLRLELDLVERTAARRHGRISSLEQELEGMREQLLQVHEEAARAEQCLTGIKAFARHTPYRQVGRVLLAMIGDR